MDKLLMISTRNLNSFNLPSGEAKLVFGRAYSLWKFYDLKTDIIDFLLPHNFGKVDPHIYEVEFGAIKHVLLKSPVEIFSNRQFYVKYNKEAMERNSYNGIILSGVFSEMFLPKDINSHFLKKRILVDIHGTPLEIMEYPKGRNKFSNIIRYKMFLISLKNRIKISNGLLVVSNSMLEYINDTFPLLADKKMKFIVPCGGFQEMHSIDEYECIRKKWRSKLKIKERDVLFIMSSGISPWQMIKENIALFKLYKEEFGHAKLLILSRYVDKVRKICEGMNLSSQDYIIMTADRNVYNDILTAGDVGLMLRDKKMTNLVAFPNKFSDYVLSNMLVVASNVKDVCLIIERYRIGITIRDIFNPTREEIELLATGIANRSENLKEVYALSKKVYGKYLYFPNTLGPLYEVTINDN